MERRVAVLEEKMRCFEETQFQMTEKIDEIYKELIGDERFSKRGLVKEHKEVYDFYAHAKWLMQTLPYMTGGSIAASIIAILKTFDII